MVAYAVDPGIVATDLGRHMRGGCLYRNLFWLIKSPKQGAQTPIFCATEEKLDEQTSLYFA